MKPSEEINCANLPAFSDRRVVRMGLARGGKEGKVVYDWARVYDLWIVRPESSLATFAKWLEIPYASLKKRDEFSVEAKAALLREAATTWRDELVNHLAVRSFGDAESATVSMAQAIRDMQETTSIAAAYARGRLVKFDAAGRPVANAMLAPAEVDRCMGIISKCSNTFRNLVEIGRSIMNARENLAAAPVARKKVAAEKPAEPIAPAV